MPPESKRVFRRVMMRTLLNSEGLETSVATTYGHAHFEMHKDVQLQQNA